MSLPTLLRGTALLLLAAAPLASQQTLTLRGELDEGRSTGCYYCPNVPYTVKFSETPVRSATVDLQFYKDLSAQLVLTGIWDTSTTPAGLEVTSVTVVGETLSFPTNARTGRDARFIVHGPAGAGASTQTALMLSLGSGFLPLFGSAALIDPSTALVVDAGPLGLDGQRETTLPVPTDAGLIGLRLWSQAVITPAGSQPLFSNPGRTDIDR